MNNNRVNHNSTSLSSVQRSAVQMPDCAGGLLPRNEQQLKASLAYVNHDLPSHPEALAVQILPECFRGIFSSFSHFNQVQTASFNAIFRLEDNVVISAPTGSGKTVLFELAICRLVYNNAGRTHKIVYMAPTKALCTERTRDWSKKFKSLDLKCGELTGDTSSTDLPVVKESDIIITTPEKWDSISRRWRDSRKLVQMIKLFLIDEVHMLKDKRGAILEVVVSRMKQIGHGIRFIALSATVPNIDDVARSTSVTKWFKANFRSWLSRSPRQVQVPAITLAFGEQYRPVQITKFVYGFAKTEKTNDFAFDAMLSKQVYGIIERHASRKPVIVFCSTRKDALKCAKDLATVYSQQTTKAWDVPRSTSTSFKDKDLVELAQSGVAFHHAGLEMSDRGAVERLFLEGAILVITATSTLAVGVNLPAHLVIVKNTLTYVGCSFEEYSDLEILQMIGRAGRPQFDDSAVAVILTEQQKVLRYETLVAGTEVLESFLHENLLEHINAEIGLGTFDNLQGALTWLKSTFLHIRVRQNPNYYRLGGGPSSIDECLENLCKKNIKLLSEYDLVRSCDDALTITPFGDAMARYYVRFETMRHILVLTSNASCKEILIAICKAEEFSSHRFRAGEKPFYNVLKKNSAIRFSYKEKTDEIWQKIMLLAQMDLCSIEVGDLKDKYKDALNNVAIHKASIRLQLMRLLSCTVDCKLEHGDSIAIHNALELRRSIAARCWENHPGMLKQLTGIGEGSLKTLISAGITSFEHLGRTDPRELERIFKRNPPFGNTILRDMMSLPQLALQVMKESTKKMTSGVELSFVVHLRCDNNPRSKKGGQPHFVIFLVDTVEGELLDFRRQAVTRILQGSDVRLRLLLKHYTKLIRFSLLCEEIVGSSTESLYSLNLSESDFPAPDLRPVNGMNIPSEPTNPETCCEQMNTVDEYLDVFGSDDDEALITLGSHVDKLLDDQEAQSLHIHNFRKDEPVCLPNGNYACNHSCKDKSKCAHACCKEGKARLNAREKLAVQQSALQRARLSAGEPFRMAQAPITFGKSMIEQSARRVTMCHIVKTDPPESQIEQSGANPNGSTLLPIIDLTENALHPSGSTDQEPGCSDSTSCPVWASPPINSPVVNVSLETETMSDIDTADFQDQAQNSQEDIAARCYDELPDIETFEGVPEGVPEMPFKDTFQSPASIRDRFADKLFLPTSPESIASPPVDHTERHQYRAATSSRASISDDSSPVRKNQKAEGMMDLPVCKVDKRSQVVQSAERAKQQKLSNQAELLAFLGDCVKVEDPESRVAELSLPCSATGLCADPPAVSSLISTAHQSFDDVCKVKEMYFRDTAMLSADSQPAVAFAPEHCKDHGLRKRKAADMLEEPAGYAARAMPKIASPFANPLATHEDTQSTSASEIPAHHGRNSFSRLFEPSRW